MYSHTKKAIILAIVLTLTPQVNYAKVTPDNIDSEQICLAKAIYHEARGEPEMSKKGVAKVVLNRKSKKNFPKTVCDVINQISFEKGKKTCQFSWVCKNKPIRDMASWEAAKLLSGLILTNKTKLPTFDSNVLYFNRSSDKFKKPYMEVVKLGNTIFYKKLSDT